MKKNNVSNRHSQKNYSEWLLAYDCNFYIEKYFHEMLDRERKRSERSKSSFLLIQVNISGLLINGDSMHAERIAQVLCSCKRETDIAGWYKYNAIMGVIFTETDKLSEDIIRQKIHKELSSILNSNQLKKIKLTFYIIP